jgi:hypothetical protein
MRVRSCCAVPSHMARNEVTRQFAEGLAVDQYSPSHVAGIRVSDQELTNDLERYSGGRTIFLTTDEHRKVVERLVSLQSSAKGVHIHASGAEYTSLMSYFGMQRTEGERTEGDANCLRSLQRTEADANCLRSLKQETSKGSGSLRWTPDPFDFPYLLISISSTQAFAIENKNVARIPGGSR